MEALCWEVLAEVARHVGRQHRDGGYGMVLGEGTHGWWTPGGLIGASEIDMTRQLASRVLRMEALLMDLVAWLTFIRDHEHAHGSRRSELTSYLGANPGGTLGAAGLLVDPSLPGVVSCQVLHHHHGDDVSINHGWPLSGASALIGRSISVTLEGRVLYLYLYLYTS